MVPQLKIHYQWSLNFNPIVAMVLPNITHFDKILTKLTKTTIATRFDELKRSFLVTLSFRIVSEFSAQLAKRAEALVVHSVTTPGEIFYCDQNTSGTPRVLI